MESIQFIEEKTNIKDMKWVPIHDYSELFLISKEEIYSNDIEIYVDLIIRKIAREFKCDYNHAKEVVREENVPFFLAKERFFEDEEYYSMRIAEERMSLKNLFNLFYIPTKNDDVSNDGVNVNKLIQLFNSLSNVERLDFLARIEKVSVKVDKIK